MDGTEHKPSAAVQELLDHIDGLVKRANSEQATTMLEQVKQLVASRTVVPGAGAVRKSVGQQFAEHAAIREFAHAKAKNSAPIEVDAHGYNLKAGERVEPFAVRLTKAAEAMGLATKDVTSSQFPQERTYLPFFPLPQRALRIRDLMPVVGIDTPQLEYARITGYSNNAAFVAEGAAKPQSEITTAVVLESAKLLATFIPVTRQAIEDVGQIRNYIDSVLEYFLQLEEDDQILNGTGGTNFTGILNVPGILSKNGAGDTSKGKLDTFRQAITDVQVAFGDAGFNPTGLVMHPKDWEERELAKDTQDRYILIPSTSTPAQGAEERLWRVPVITTPAIAEGTALLGAWDIGATLWVLHGLTLRVTDSHSDWFIKNLLAVLAEFRELFAVYFPKAFVKITNI